MYDDDIWITLAEQTIRQVLTHWSQTPWSVVIYHETVHLHQYDAAGVQQRHYLEHLPAAIKKRLERTVQRAIRQQQDQLLVSTGKRTIGSVVAARVVGRTLQGDLALQLEQTTAQRCPFTSAVCPTRYQPPRERGHQDTGDLRQYLVTGILMPHGVGQVVMVRLSRTSHRLPLALLREAGFYEPVRCERRIAGAFCQLATQSWIPPEILRNLSHELQERIDVRRIP